MNFTIPHNTVISFAKVYGTGHKPYLILADDYEQYVLKTQNNKQDKDAIVKEFLCSNLLKTWYIDTPEIASLSLNQSLAENHIFRDDKTFAMSSVYFGSKYVGLSIDVEKLFTAKSKATYNLFHNPGIILDIALFDIWTENDDRKPSNYNLLFVPFLKGLQIIAIDHAFTFASLPFIDINQVRVSFSDNDSILNIPLAKSIIKRLNINSEWIHKAEEKFYLCVLKSKENINKIFESIPTEFTLNQQERDKIEGFLFSDERNKIVFDQFKYIISSIK